MKSELVSDSVQQLNCSGANAAMEVEKLCDQVLSYLKLGSFVEEAHRQMTKYTQDPEVSLTVNSTWNETQYALNLAQTVPQEIAAVLQAI